MGADGQEEHSASAVNVSLLEQKTHEGDRKKPEEGNLIRGGNRNGGSASPVSESTEITDLNSSHSNSNSNNVLVRSGKPLDIQSMMERKEAELLKALNMAKHEAEVLQNF
jgi:hypothetical protein